MSQSSSHVNDFVVRPRAREVQKEVSLSEVMPILQATGPLREEDPNSNPSVQEVGASHPHLATPNPCVAERAEAAYQGIMSSLPSFVKKSVPPNLTDDQLDGITTYFSTPHDKIDTHLALEGEQLYIPHIENNSSDPDLRPGYTSVYVEAFTFEMRLPFSRFLNNLLISINRAPGQLAPIGGGRM
ncbi:hypothetical protein LIER_00386 [Lithospermum erythrorhizon]|uniref:Uncharacterized protein n=1 Tax=Lithospermum erythrorhizon TaxID=34254 RepID=A0AAV3NH61_LITER